MHVKIQRPKNVQPVNKDKRGKIINILEGKITSILLIESKKGSVRANHYHKKDSHYVYMISGKMRYTTKDLKKYAKKRVEILNKGDLIFTPPRIIHAMEFLHDSVFLALTTQKRDQKTYENDIVRVKLV